MSTKTKPLTLADVIEGLEQVIEEWGDEAKGGTHFDLWVDDEIKLLPHCLVGTYIHDVTDGLYNSPSGLFELGLSDDQLNRFLWNVIDGVDHEENPDEDWQKGLDLALEKWGLK